MEYSQLGITNIQQKRNKRNFCATDRNEYKLSKLRKFYKEKGIRRWRAEGEKGDVGEGKGIKKRIQRCYLQIPTHTRNVNSVYCKQITSKKKGITYIHQFSTNSANVYYNHVPLIKIIK